MDQNKNQQVVDKEFGLTSLSLRNKITVYVITFIIVAAGIYSYITLPKENFPEVEQPTVYVSTVHPGNSPEDMENLITRELEKEINTIEGVDNIQSTSVQDYSAIVVEFQVGIDVDDAVIDVKDAVDRAKSELPSDLKSDPEVIKFSISENFPILNINLTDPTKTLDELNDMAEYLEDEIEKFQEISKVNIVGVDEKEVKIKVDPFKLEARKVTFNDIENAISAENVTLSGGNVIADGIRRNVRIIGEFDDPKQMLDIIISNENNNIVYLRDVATVEYDYKDKQNYARLDLDPVVKVDVMKRSGENLLVATDKIMAVIAESRVNGEIPESTKVTITNDQSKDTREQVSSLGNNIIFGVILVVTVLLFFLGTRNSLFVGMAIPLSMFMALMILGLAGISINTMTLFGLIMALGMLVDNGIVVVENVYRLMEEGLSPMAATRRGVGEVALPIISSTATTLAAFIPLAFWPGIMGDFMMYLPLTLIITLGSSLFVALVINPVFISSFMRLDGTRVIDNKKVLIRSSIALVLGIVFAFVLGAVAFGNLLMMIGGLTLLNVYVLNPLSKRFQAGFLPVLENQYEKVLKRAVRSPMLYLGGAFGLLIFSLVLFGIKTPQVVFFPENEPRYVNVFIEFPVGTDIDATNDFAVDIEQQVIEIVKPYESIVESITTNVSQGAGDPGDPTAVGQSEEPHKARITVNFIESKLRGDINTLEVMEDIRAKVKLQPGVTLTVDKDAAGPPTGKPINLEIAGEDLEVLIGISERVVQRIQESGIQGIEQLKSSLELGKPELVVDIDRDNARRFGLSTMSIANEIRTALFGREVSKYKEGEDSYEINVRLNQDYRYNIDALLNKNITFRDQNSGQLVQVPISSVADVHYSSTYGSIKRKDLDRVVTLSSNVLGGFNATEINEQLKVLMEDFEMPAGYSYAFTGEQEEQAENMAFLAKALLIAVFMIFLIIVSQFNKITAPFIIMVSVLLSTIGVFLGLVIFNMKFVVIMTMVGIIALAGIVVNNAIVLIDFIELTRKRKREELGLEEGARLPMNDVIESIIIAGKTRLRPVLLTAITTILGLVPLAVGLNIDFIGLFTQYNADFYVGGDNVIFWGPMSWTIIFGLTFATFLTLIIVPTMYLIADKIMYRIDKFRGKNDLSVVDMSKHSES
ncbi:efflux RND transporter permease subunit [Roseivirga pacifica]|uniref:efflux RND transporter permease subunit n=1 Tax=Roseivirga pacifica TaxID=1267423 RepID=UPI0020948649|nr:efflux RND transporter permease subunit [Roseivirga pacifica]MCO6357966.1 AcrB/AcrD/AcrF family protein [Roseivirga pacifica]MCO6366405.1 AcrB/AcrD/AcrF family protein [Roseivirga pacifica]MCO6370890.1 AcrB/AcrD/AcrF family protein [Roseivirga pacifica]MCO6373698.1 AcrB/AcrD/AcrF family protein [Roseivirga pacifica]MCO6380679.1 AcrB/AcrD/AcrF family protein [Roseivirga pacifica]